MIVVGVDLGQSQDFTAIAVCRRIAVNPTRWDVPHLERLPLGTAYTEAVKHVVRMLERPELERAYLAVDRTGVGAAVCDLLAANLPEGRGIRFHPICLTSGHAVSKDGRGGLNVPKKDIVGAVQILLQGKRLRIARELPMADVLVKEFLNFQTKITLAENETFGAWREGKHDDLLLALGIALWLGEATPRDNFAGLWEMIDRQNEVETEPPAPKSRLENIFDDVGIDVRGDW